VTPNAHANAADQPQRALELLGEVVAHVEERQSNRTLFGDPCYQNEIASLAEMVWVPNARRVEAACLGLCQRVKPVVGVKVKHPNWKRENGERWRAFEERKN